jgi:hypothetical protein
MICHLFTDQPQPGHGRYALPLTLSACAKSQSLQYYISIAVHQRPLQLTTVSFLSSILTVAAFSPLIDLIGCSQDPASFPTFFVWRMHTVLQISHIVTVTQLYLSNRKHRYVKPASNVPQYGTSSVG